MMNFKNTKIIISWCEEDEDDVILILHYNNPMI